MSQDNNSLSEQAVNKLTEAAISSQLDEVEDIDVEVKSDPIQLIQGKVDSVAIAGEGMVMKKDLRLEQMNLQTGAIAVNPLSIPFGKIELTDPTDATIRAILTEADINRAFNSDYIRQKLQRLEVSVQGEPTTLDTQKVEFRLPESGKIFLAAQVYLPKTGETKQIAFTAEPRVSDDRRQLLLDNLEYQEGEGLSPELTDALLDLASELLNLDNFELEGIKLRVRQLEMKDGKIILLGEACIEQFPSVEDL